jgi:hypothetical protein
VTEPVIGRALLRVLERVVGFVDFLELVLGFTVAGVAVRVELHGELAIGALEGRLVGALGHAQHIVIVAFGHWAPSLTKKEAPRNALPQRPMIYRTKVAID